MSTQTLQPVRHISLKAVAAGIAGAALAVTAGFGLASLLVDEDTISAPGQSVVTDDVRDSWENRLGIERGTGTGSGDVGEPVAPPVGPGTSDFNGS